MTRTTGLEVHRTRGWNGGRSRDAEQRALRANAARLHRGQVGDVVERPRSRQFRRLHHGQGHRALALLGGHTDRIVEVPPGVDVELWRPEARVDALAALLAEAALDPPNPGNAEERLPDEGNAGRLEAFLADDRPTVVYFGKLIPQKGVDVLLRSLRGLDARAVIVGFGDYRAELEARAAGLDVLFTGPLEHRHLVHLLALADVAVVPSIFPEAFGMVAAEAAATGCPPVVADHSGLAEVAREARQFNPREFRVVASAKVVELFLDDESQHLAGLSDFIGKPISLQAEVAMGPEDYDIVLM